MLFSIKSSDAAFDHSNVPSPVAHLITNPLQLVQPLEVHPDTLQKLTIPPAGTQVMLARNGFELNFSPLMQFPPSIAFNTASSTSYANTSCAVGLEEVEGTADGLRRSEEELLATSLGCSKS